MMRSFWRRRRDERGAVLALTCIAMVVMMGSAALAVDIGRETVRNRRLEQVSEAVAFDAMRAVNGQTVSQLTAATGPVTLAVQDSAARNNFPVQRLAVQLGTYASGTFTPTNNPNDVPTAVQAAATETTNFLFQQGSITGSRGANLGGAGCVGGSCGNQCNGSGCAQPCPDHAACVIKTSAGGFSIGSWLASISSTDGGILGSLFSDTFHLNVVGYSGLVSSTLTLQALGLNMPASVGVLSPTQLLNTSVGINNFMLAAVSALNAQGNTAAANVLNSMILNASTTGTIKLGDFIDVAAGGEAAAASASFDVLGLLTAGAMVMEKNGGHALTIPTSTVSVPGVASITASATVIEPPQFYFGPVGGSVSTAQIRLSVIPVINVSAGSNNTPCTLSLGNLLGLVGCLLNPVLPVGVSLNGSLPIDLSVAGATGTLTAVNCTTPGITVGSVTQAVNLNAAANLSLDLTLLGSPFLNAARISIAAGVKTAPGNYSTSFSYPGEFGLSHTKSVGSASLGLNGVLSVNSGNVSVLNGTLNTAAVSTIVANLAVPALSTILSGLDTQLVAPLAKMLDAKFGGADIAALGYECNELRLAG